MENISRFLIASLNNNKHYHIIAISSSIRVASYLTIDSHWRKLYKSARYVMDYERIIAVVSLLSKYFVPINIHIFCIITYIHNGVSPISLLYGIPSKGKHENDWKLYITFCTCDLLLRWDMSNVVNVKTKRVCNVNVVFFGSIYLCQILDFTQRIVDKLTVTQRS